METRANYVLIGAFTVAGLVGIMGFFLWFARVELDRSYAYYDIRFSSVSGLSNASDVRFSGLPVGQVVDVRLSPDQDGTILVRVEVGAETPVRTDSLATIEAQGVTGVSFVSIGPGTATAPLLADTSDEEVPEIEAGRSVLQSLSEDAPRLLEQVLVVVQNVGNLLGGDNQGRLERILLNVEAASEDFAGALGNFSEVAGTVTDFVEQIDRFNATLDGLTAELTGVLATADDTIASVGDLSVQAREVLSGGSDALAAARNTVVEAERYIAEDLTGATRDVQAIIADLQTQVSVLGADARNLMGTLDTTGTEATARLVEARATLEAANTLIAGLDETTRVVGQTASRIDGLIQSDGAPLVSETRVAVAEATRAIQSVGAVTENDLPAVMSDIRDAAQTSARVVAEVGENLSSASGRVDEVVEAAQIALAEVTRTFGNANETLAAINGAMETGDRALDAAERAFSGASRIIDDDISGAVADLESTMETLNAAIGQVSDDLPEISNEIRSASQSASAAFFELERMAGASAPAIATFATTALPLYTRLAQETRGLIANLDRLTQQIQRDPARFFLDPKAPEFRR